MVELPKIGMRLHSGLEPQQCVELAKIAESSHFASVWFAENPFERGIMPSASACALATSRIRICIGVWNPFNRHPTLMAMEIGALDSLSQGRAVLGIGSGRAPINQQMGWDNRRPLGAMRDTFRIVRGMLQGEQVTHEGAVFSVTDVKLGYKPLRRDIPLIMAARGDKALELAGEVADGVILANMCPPGFTRYAMNLIRQGHRKANRSGVMPVVQYVSCIARPDGAQARKAIKPAVAAGLRNYWELGQTIVSAKRAILESGIAETEIQRVLDRVAAGEPPDQSVSEQFVDAFAIAGTAAQCRDMMMAYAREGVTELVLTMLGTQPVEDLQYLSNALELA
jgi:5,10-methylenetetrahydromethanopterin reductase